MSRNIPPPSLSLMLVSLGLRRQAASVSFIFKSVDSLLARPPFAYQQSYQQKLWLVAAKGEWLRSTVAENR